MPIAIAETDQNGNAGCVPGRNCYPSGLGCLGRPRSIELCIDPVASTYDEGGFVLETDPMIIACPAAADCLLGPCDPYGVPYTPPPNISFLLVVPEGEDDPVLKMFVDGVEAAPGYSAPEGTPCIWVGFYGYH